MSKRLPRQLVDGKSQIGTLHSLDKEKARFVSAPNVVWEEEITNCWQP